MVRVTERGGGEVRTHNEAGTEVGRAEAIQRSWAGFLQTPPRIYHAARGTTVVLDESDDWTCAT